MSRDNRQLLDQQVALDCYLDSLLGDEPEPAEPSGGQEAAVVDLPDAPETSPANDEAEADSLPAWPEWLGESVRCLGFMIGEERVAAPLDRLYRVIPREGIDADGKLSAPWYLGAIPVDGHAAPVVDGEQWLKGEAASEAVAAGAGHVLLFDDGEWGLTCSRIGEVAQFPRDALERLPDADGRILASLPDGGGSLIDPDRILEALFSQD